MVRSADGLMKNSITIECKPITVRAKRAWRGRMGTVQYLFVCLYVLLALLGNATGALTVNWILNEIASNSIESETYTGQRAVLIRGCCPLYTLQGRHTKQR